MFKKKKINQPAPYFFANQNENLTNIYFMWPKSSADIDVLYDFCLMKRKTLKHMHLR